LFCLATAGNKNRLSTGKQLPGSILLNRIFSGINFGYDFRLDLPKSLLGFRTGRSAFSEIGPMYFHNFSPVFR